MRSASPVSQAARGQGLVCRGHPQQGLHSPHTHKLKKENVNNMKAAGVSRLHGWKKTRSRLAPPYSCAFFANVGRCNFPPYSAGISVFGCDPLVSCSCARLDVCPRLLQLTAPELCKYLSGPQIFFFWPGTTSESVGQCLHRGYATVCTQTPGSIAAGSPRLPETR